MKIFKNFIGGDWVPPISGEYFENLNPADVSDSIGRFPLSGAADVDRAVESARRGFEVWRATPAIISVMLPICRIEASSD